MIDHFYELLLKDGENDWTVVNEFKTKEAAVEAAKPHGAGWAVMETTRVCVASDEKKNVSQGLLSDMVD